MDSMERCWAFIIEVKVTCIPGFGCIGPQTHIPDKVAPHIDKADYTARLLLTVTHFQVWNVRPIEILHVKRPKPLVA